MSDRKLAFTGCGGVNGDTAGLKLSSTWVGPRWGDRLRTDWSAISSFVAMVGLPTAE